MGGAFNPFHIGHLRHAIEIAEELELDAVDLLVSYDHPQKEGLLPFDIRVECIQKSLEHIDFIHINTIESTIEGKSYTDVILTEWKKQHPLSVPFFLMGIEDFGNLPTWHNGLDLHKLAHLIIVGRLGKNAEDFLHTAQNYWENLTAAKTDGTLPLSGQKKVRLLQNNKEICTFINIPTLNVDATTIRKLWCGGKNIKGLVHDGVIEILNKKRTIIKQYWQ